MRIKIYIFLVNRIPEIQKKYHILRKQKKGISGRIYAWCALLWMNFLSIFMGRRLKESFYYPDRNKCILKDSAESSHSVRETPRELAEKLKKYDVISFDIFDTLIFRPFSAPTDLFYIVGERLNYMDFEQIRRQAEHEARLKEYKKSGSYEVTLEQIYEEVELQTGISHDVGMKMEINVELECCMPNPYMFRVLELLRKEGKTIVCTSDMYLPQSVIAAMLQKCGYQGIEKIFVSCECAALKGNGTLYQLVKQTFGSDKTYIHTGDNHDSDVKWAKRSGFDSVYYPNVNVEGSYYRAEDLTAINGSLYRGIVNMHIHNGLKQYSQVYEIGFIYGGLFILGYCQWIHEYVRCHNIDKILFLARDGDIVKQAYDLLYPEEKEKGITEYVYWSRLAATKLGAVYYKRDYFRRFIDHKVNQNYTLQDIFASMEISQMLDGLCQVNGLEKDSLLTDRNAKVVKKYLNDNWSCVLEAYDEQHKAAKLYYEPILKGCQKVVAVDVGWAGSGAIVLNQLVNHIWHLDCQVVGLVAGSNTIHDYESRLSVSQLESGNLNSYMYSQCHNREFWKWHDAAKGHNVGVELICSSSDGSLKGFYLDEKKEDYRLRFKDADVSVEKVKEIRSGVLDFVKMAQATLLANRQVCGYDAYQVLRIFLNSEENMQQLMEEFDIGI